MHVVTHLELEFLHLALKIIGQCLARRGAHLLQDVLPEHFLESLVSFHLEPVAVLGETALYQVQPRVKVSLHGIWQREGECPHCRGCLARVTKQRESTGKVRQLVLYKSLKGHRKVASAAVGGQV